MRTVTRFRGVLRPRFFSSLISLAVFVLYKVTEPKRLRATIFERVTRQRTRITAGQTKTGSGSLGRQGAPRRFDWTRAHKVWPASRGSLESYVGFVFGRRRETKIYMNVCFRSFQ